ncbi:hypothetical protein AB4Y45_32500 [Paraburkholderia sp. EG287A]|uniref:hypothetical protein n=1 Tax=Paraburkholderia sp. EG287A TaxID=3237012 RepID=UPI0034D34B4A
MSRLQTLLRAAFDYVFPAQWPELSDRHFFSTIPGAWKRDDNSGLCTWGYVSLRLSVDTEDFTLNFERFVTEVSLMDIASVHVGLASWPAPESHIQDWYGAQTATESISLLDLAQSRKAWLKSLGLCERLGYVIVRVKLDGDVEVQRATLAELQATLEALAYRLGHGYRPLTRAEIVRVDAERKDQETETVADFSVEASTSASTPVLMHALAWADHDGYGGYHATLDIQPDAGTLRAGASMRILNPAFGLRTLEMELHRCGITIRKIPLRRLLHFPLRRNVSRWQSASDMNLVALAPCAVRPIASEPRAGGMPLKSMTGELRTFAPFDSSMNYNTLVLGEKAQSHEVACEMLSQHLASAGAVCIVDDEGNFNHLARVFNGEVQIIGTDGPQGLDPLRLVKDEYDIVTFVLRWLGALADGQQPTEYARRLLAEAVHSLWRTAPRDQFTLANLHGELLGMGDPRAVDLAAALAPYVGGGAYAMLFEGPAREVPDNALTVFDLSPWKGHAVLPHIAHAILALQTRKYGRHPCRTARRLFIHSLSLAYSAQQATFEGWLRGLRPYNMGAVVLGHPDDVEPGGALREVAFNCSNKIALSLTEKAAAALDLDRHVWDASIWQLNTSSLYAATPSMRAGMQLLLVTPDGTGFFQLRLDPASRDLFALRPARPPAEKLADAVC